MKVKQLNVLYIASRDLGNRTRDQLEPMDCGTLLNMNYVENAYPEIFELCRKRCEPIDRVIIQD